MEGEYMIYLYKYKKEVTYCIGRTNASVREHRRSIVNIMNVYLSKFKKVSSQIKSLDNYCSSSVTFILHITIQAYFLEEEGRRYGEY